jgi:hypothetical protein
VVLTAGGTPNITAASALATHTVNAVVDGADDGTYSINRVEGGAGDDVIVLNAGSRLDTTTSPDDHLINDTLVLTGAFGNDSVFNFDTGANAADRIDKIAVGSLLGPNASAVSTGAIGTANSVNVSSAANAAAANHVFTAAEFITAHGSAYTAAGTSVVFMRDSTVAAGENQNLNVYTVFQVVADATSGLTDNEVRLLGTITFEDDMAVLTQADFVL